MAREVNAWPKAPVSRSTMGRHWRRCPANICGRRRPAERERLARIVAFLAEAAEGGAGRVSSGRAGTVDPPQKQLVASRVVCDRVWLGFSKS